MIGIVEGFFGPQWSKEARIDYASFLKNAGGDFYIYAPKQDGNLRKNWREEWSEEYLSYIKSLVDLYHQHGLLFGVALSPFGLDQKLDEENRKVLSRKMEQLNHLGIDLLGVFFDDMHSYELLAEVQIEVVSFLKTKFTKKIIFCPTYYTPDPILEKVFGKMPEGYLTKIADGIPLDVEIAWTGPKVISSEIGLEHMREVEALLKRKPFIWENLFANDGPKNCKFLKLKAFDGREKEIMNHTSGYAFNLMNQPYLSEIAFLASVLTLKGQKPEEAYKTAIGELCSPLLVDFILEHDQSFLKEGLDQLTAEKKNALITILEEMYEPQAKDIRDWLRGDYLVGSECLTD